jgi:capsular polysaccharide biosynthesis protein
MFKRFWWVFLVMIPIGAIAGLLVAAVVTYVMPKKYESQAIIEVKPVESSPISPQFFGTEFEKIKSRDSLTKVVSNLELNNRWGLDKETAISILKGIITTENIRGTDLISIKVRHTNKEDARDVAAEAGKSYREYRREIRKRLAEQGLFELRKAVRAQDDKVEERRKVVAAITKRDLGQNLDPDNHSRTINEPMSLADAKKSYELDQELLQSLKLKSIEETTRARLIDGGIVIHESPVIAQVPASPNVTLNLALGAAAESSDSLQDTAAPGGNAMMAALACPHAVGTMASWFARHDIIVRWECPHTGHAMTSPRGWNDIMTGTP